MNSLPYQINEDILISEQIDPLYLQKSKNEILKRIFGQGQATSLLIKKLVEKGVDIKEKISERKTILHLSCEIQQKDRFVIEQIIEFGVKVNEYNENGQTALHLAVINKFPLETIEILLKSKANTNIQDNWKKTPLHYACENNLDFGIIKALIRYSAKVNIKDHAQRTPLHHAMIKNASPEIARLLLKKQKNINCVDKHKRTVLHYALEAGVDEEVVKAIFSKKPKVKLLDENLRSALHFACKSGYSCKIIEELLKRGSKISIEDAFSLTPLHHLCGNKSIFPQAKLLIKHGAKIHVKDIYSRFPAHFACQSGCDVEVLKILISPQMEINSRDHHGKTFLHYACEREGSIEIAKFLISQKINVGIRDNLLNTALHHAVQTGDSELVQVLLSSGFQTEDRNNEYRSVLHCACLQISEKQAQILSVLLSHGAVVDAYDNFGKTPLFYLCENQASLDCVKILIDAGADPKTKDRYSQKTPLHHVSDPDLAELLLKAGADPNELSSTKQSAMLSSFINLIRQLNKDSQKVEKQVLVLIKKFLLYKADINTKDSKGNNVILLAFSYPNIFRKIFKYFIRNGGDPNTQDANKHSLLHLACINRIGHEIVQDLINAGANVNAKDFFDLIPLSYALQKRDFLSAKNLLLSNSQVDEINTENIDEDMKIMLRTYNTIQKEMLDFFKRGEFTDFVFNCKDGNVSIHKLIAQFRLTDPEQKEPNIELMLNNLSPKFLDMTCKDARLFFKFLYSGILRDSGEKNSFSEMQRICDHLKLSKNWIAQKLGKKGLIQDLTRMCDLYRGMFLSVKDDSNSVSDYSGKSFNTINLFIRYLYIDDFDESDLTYDVIHELSDAKDYYQLSDNCFLDFFLAFSNEKRSRFGLFLK
ncbi:ankyrin repeat-containing [Anaeramoeba ignava]|uniref:Ankyrin repeat-containing n=1 Tax=Anaeramoeba ignava TaxID=1746090 RepID=A0A9Q0RHS4_ANAIG|nr:ankyrin repeat-containing [Anaeramoeba ignava]